MIINAPIIAHTDVLICGFSTGAVEAALAAREAGRDVFMIGSASYPGSDVCATARYWLDPDQTPQTPLAHALFSSALRDGIPVRPMAIKVGLEKAMLEAGVQWLYLTYPVCLLRDAHGELAGCVIANRSGFQAILASALIDTTDRAQAAALTGARFRPFRSGIYAAERTTLQVLNRWPSIPCHGRPLPGEFQVEDRSYGGFAHSLTLEMKDASVESWSAVETEARLKTWHPALTQASDVLSMLPSDRLDAGQPLSEEDSADSLVSSRFQCGHDLAFVLGPRMDASDDALKVWLKPCHLMAAGKHLGRDVAERVTPGSSKRREVTPDYIASPVADVDACRRDVYFRFSEASTLPLDLNAFPELASVNVAVVGGGTGGAPAGIAAGRAGASVVLLESLFGLGGVGTEGRICGYWFGNRCGFTRECDDGVVTLAPDPDFDMPAGRWNSEWKKHWLLRESVQAGVRPWWGSTAIASLMQDNRVCGVLAATPCGVGMVRADAVVDASGNADVAASGGARTVNISKAHVAVQGTGLSPMTPGKHKQNSDYTFVDDTDVMDVTRAFVLARRKFQDYFDVVQLVDSRQRQQVEGDVSLDPLDFLAGRTFPDTVVKACSNFDSHGFTIHPVFMAKAPDEEPLEAYVPFRCLLPQGLDGILVTGLGVSAHRDALPVIRMQADVQNQGYAAGWAAAMAAHDKRPMRSLDIRRLQKHLVKMGNLDASVLEQEDSFPLPQEKLQQAVAGDLQSYVDLAIIFGHPTQTLPMMHDVYREAKGEHKLRVAHLLGLMGDDVGVETLLDYVDSNPWDEGWDFRGMGQFGFSLSPLDSMIVALGRSGTRDAIPTLLRKAEALPTDAAFSHFRALTLAFEALPDERAASSFIRFLKSTQTASRHTLQEQLREVPASDVDVEERNRELKELLIARGLFACGDPDGSARAVLEAYSHDLHGHYARHARSLLESRVHKQ